MPVTYKSFSNSIAIKESSGEIDLRNAVSRDYYGLYHFLIEYGESNGYKPDEFEGKSHEKVLNMVEYILDEKYTKVGVMNAVATIISVAKSHRVTADYKLDRSLNQSHVLHNRSAIDRIKKLLDLD